MLNLNNFTHETVRCEVDTTGGVCFEEWELI